MSHFVPVTGDPLMGSRTRRADVLERLKEVGTKEDREIDLAGAALLLAAADRADRDLSPYRRHLDALATDAAATTDGGASVAAQIAALREVIVHRYGYHGDEDTYDDLRNANLMDVIDRRKGLPVALGIVYIHTARRCGSDIVGLNFPAHFLVRIEARGQRAIVDPFDAGRPVDTPELRRRIKDIVGKGGEMTPDHYRAVANREVLVRLQNNIKMRAIAGGDLQRALAILETLTAIVPEETEFWWESALIHHQRGNSEAAIRTLENRLAEAGADDKLQRIEELLRRLRARTH